MEISFLYFQNLLILSYISYKKKIYYKNKKIFFPHPLNYKNNNKKFFHVRLNFVSEVILYSIDLKINYNYFEREIETIKKILKEKNLIIFRKFGGGSNFIFVFGLFFKFWLGYKKKNSLPYQKKPRFLYLFIFSREDQKQIIQSLVWITNVFYIKTGKKKVEENKIFKNKGLFVYIIPKCSRLFFFNSKLMKKSGGLFIKGDLFINDYHVFFIKFKNISLFKKKNLQKILIFIDTHSNNLFIGRNITHNYKNKNFNPYFLGNQILDISDGHFEKICRLLDIIFKLDRHKIIVSYSWGRCLLIGRPIIKAIRKLIISHKTIEFIKIKEKVYFVFNFGKNIKYFTCCLSKYKTLKKINYVILFDIYQEFMLSVDFLKFFKIAELISLSFYLFIKSNKMIFLKLFKIFLLKKN